MKVERTLPGSREQRAQRTKRLEAGRVSRRVGSKLGWLALVVAGVSCGGSKSSGPAATSPEPSLEPAQRKLEELPDVALRLKQRVEQLSLHPDGATPQALAATFQLLASSVAPSSQAEARTIRAAAGELNAARADAEGGSRLAVRALRPVSSSLSSPPAGRGTFGQEVQPEFEALLRAIDAESTLDEAREEIVAALRAATNLVYVAHREPPPFEVSGPMVRRLPPTLCAGAERARESVAALAQASSFEARARAAEALNTFADALAIRSSASAASDDIRAIRFEASLLQREGTFDGALVVKNGLSRVVSLLASATNGERVEAWVESSRKAVDAIETGFVSFERAAIQDAFRQIADTLTILARDEGACR